MTEADDARVRETAMDVQSICFRLLDHACNVTRMDDEAIRRDASAAAQHLLAADEQLGEMRRTLGALAWLSWPQMIARFSPTTQRLIMARVERARELGGSRSAHLARAQEDGERE